MKAILSFFVLLLVFASDMHAVAFKLCNHSSQTFRARVYDRDVWRGFVEFGPDGWGDFAPGVTRSEHTVEIQILTASGWKEFYYGNHGSKLWTRIVQIYETPDGTLQMRWWDERGRKCRDAPPHPTSHRSTCLDSSGGGHFKSIAKLVWKNRRKVLEYVE